MKMKKLTALLLTALMVLSLAACGAKDDSKADNGGETATVEEAAAAYKSLMDRENEILSENTDLWEKVFLEADKGMAMIEDGKNYGDFLLDTVEAINCLLYTSTIVLCHILHAWLNGFFTRSFAFTCRCLYVDLIGTVLCCNF